MEKPVRSRRRNYFIDKSFQSKFIIKFCSIVIIASFAIGILTYYFNRQTTTVAFENLRVVVKSTSDFILPTLFFIIVIVTVFVSLATVVVTLFTSHKISGPLYRLKAELEKIKGGDLSSRISIRADDQLQKVAAEFEELRLEFKNSIGTLKKNWNLLKEHLEKLKTAAANEEDRKTLEQRITEIDKELAKFKI